MLKRILVGFFFFNPLNYSHEESRLVFHKKCEVMQVNVCSQCFVPQPSLSSPNSARSLCLLSWHRAFQWPDVWAVFLPFKVSPLTSCPRWLGNEDVILNPGMNLKRRASMYQLWAGRIHSYRTVHHTESLRWCRTVHSKHVFTLTVAVGCDWWHVFLQTPVGAPRQPFSSLSSASADWVSRSLALRVLCEICHGRLWWCHAFIQTDHTKKA